MAGIIHYVIEIANVAVEMVLIMMYFSLLCPRKHDSVFPILTAYVMSVIGLSTVVLLNADAVILLISTSIILLAIAIFIFEESLRSKLLWVLTYILIITIAEPLMIGLLCMTNFGSPKDFLETGAGRMIGMLGTKILYLWLIALVNRIMKGKIRDLPMKYWVLILVIPIVSVFMLQSILVYVTTEDIKVNYVICGVEIAGILYINVAMFNFFESYDNKIRLEYLERFKQQEQENYRMLSLTYKQMREFKHDIENQFSVLSSFLEQNDIKAASEYLGELNNFVKIANVVCYTGNNAIDSLVNTKATFAKSMGIEFICKINIITEIKADDMELCRIIGNALDNAIEGCERTEKDKKHIYFSLNEKDESLVLLVSNTSNYVDTDDLSSTKKDKGLHGIGTQSIRSSVERLNGIIDFSYADGLFTLTLMVRN